MSVMERSRKDKVTVRTVQDRKVQHVPITMLTAYDYSYARLVDKSGVDIILVGDSLAMVILGYENTLSVTMEEMLHHCRAVSRGTQRAMLVGDMPFLSYQVTVAEAVRNAGLFLKEGHMDAVKLEGGRERIDAVKAIVNTGIPVMGHIGLTPQSVHQFGGFLVQGKSAEAGLRLLQDALLLEEAGCYSIVLKSVPDRLAAYISSKLRIPTIGIGAGVGCDGQVLVTQDMLGLLDQFKPKFVKVYRDIRAMQMEAFREYTAEVVERAFPTDEHSFHMIQTEWDKFLELAEGSPHER